MSPVYQLEEYIIEVLKEKAIQGKSLWKVPKKPKCLDMQ
jgi:hypothetical protein